MARSFDFAEFSRRLRARDPRVIARMVLGVLLLANLIAAYTVFRPLGGSAEELDQQIAVLQNQIKQRQANNQRLKLLVAKMDKARTTGDLFMENNFISRRSMSSTIVSELTNAAKDSGMKTKEHSFQFEPIEGSETISMMTITGNYEGTYGDLLQFVNKLDRSSRFLIIESLNAAPQTSGNGVLNVSIKMDTFVREDGPTA